MIDVVKRIDDLRKSRDWSIYKLSMETGLTQQTIHAWYNSNKMTTPSIATLEVVCEAFGITMAEFFTEKYLVEVTHQTKSLYDNLCSLSEEERKAVATIIKLILKRK